jgi:membrane-bound lytic murein transglycosylase D
VPIEKTTRFTSELASLGDRERVRWTRHRVKQGETIGAVAEHYQTTASTLREVNHLRGNTLRAGDELLIPSPMGPLSAYTRSSTLRDQQRERVALGDQQRTHVVASGDTLWSIAKRYGVDVRSLAAWNAMAPGDVLRVGRKLVVGAGSTNGNAVADRAPAQPTAQPTAVAGTDDAAKSAPSSTRSRQVTYVVRRGDSLSSIARRFRVTIPKLMEWNAGAGNNYLQPGQRLVVFVDATEQSG